MPNVTFQGPVDPGADGTEAVVIDREDGEQVELRIGGDPVDLTDGELTRLTDLPGLQFEVDGETVANVPAEAEVAEEGEIHESLQQHVADEGDEE